MGELLLRKALACRNRIERIRAALPADPKLILADERLEAQLLLRTAAKTTRRQ